MSKDKLWVLYDQENDNTKHPRKIFDELGAKLYIDTEGEFSYYLRSYAYSFKMGYGLLFNINYNNKSYAFELFKTNSKGINVYPLTLEYGLSDDKYEIVNDIQFEKTLIELIKSPLTSTLLFKINENFKDDK